MAKWNLKKIVLFEDLIKEDDFDINTLIFEIKKNNNKRMDIKDVLVRLNDIIHAKDPKAEAVRFKRDLIVKLEKEN